MIPTKLQYNYIAVKLNIAPLRENMNSFCSINAQVSVAQNVPTIKKDIPDFRF